jgi:AraC-like DNA-binding protein
VAVSFDAGLAKHLATLYSVESWSDVNIFDRVSSSTFNRVIMPYFLRCFEDLTGTTPHQYVLRARLRRAATRLNQEHARIIDIALDCGFGDVSNFNRSFRAEFGNRPRLYRRHSLTLPGHSHFAERRYGLR